MEVLWLAIIIYSIGMAAMLHFRPALMFHENGTWKEFGYQRDSRHTIFPFWLFSVVWAFLSYVLATTFSWSSASTAVVSSAMLNRDVMIPVSQEEDYEANEEDVEEEDDVMMAPPPPPRRPRGRPRKDRTFTIPVSTELPSQVTAPAQPRAGYYIVDPATEGSGLHRYIYYGPNPPTPSESSA
jgi:hypothetical protein